MLEYRSRVEKVAKYDLFVVRQKHDGSLGCSAPCNECLRWINCMKVLGVTIKIHYVDYEGKITEYNSHSCCGHYKPPDTIW
jgi:hypothetical protein